MTRVQQPHFHFLIRQDSGSHFRARLFPRGTSMKEMILDYPLAERLWYDRPSVIDTKVFPHKCAMRICSGWRDSIHHAVGKRAILFQPVPDRRIAKLQKPVTSA